MILQQWMRPIALSAWIVAFVLALAVGYLVLWRTPKPVPFVQEEHGMVLRLTTLPMQGENHGH
jgi:lipopolysaccharide/colanic/teichoic acid biosynthesis glycosyltransferase